jgi:hypothetical protein
MLHRSAQQEFNASRVGATANNEDLIVTGDRHLLKLKKQYQGIPIMRLADLLRMLSSESSEKRISNPNVPPRIRNR